MLNRWLEVHGAEPISQHVSPNAAVLNATDTIADVRKMFRDGKLSRDRNRTCYLYVVDSEQCLLGVLPVCSLMYAEDCALVSSQMCAEVVSVSSTDTVGQVLPFLYLSNLAALPVVADGKLIGAFGYDYLHELRTQTGVSANLAELRADLSLLLGFDEQAVRHASIVGAFRLRSPWLMVTTLAGASCAWLIVSHEAVVDNYRIVPAFIPLVLALADAVCHQGSSIAIVEHLGSRRTGRALLRAIVKELCVASAIGLFYACLVTVAAMLLCRQVLPAIAIGVSVAVAVAAAGVTGLGVAAGISYSRRNPHISGGPIALAITDCIATATLLATAWHFLF